eukprot:9225002-Lingulodinium_polyedra.AAC.1
MNPQSRVDDMRRRLRQLQEPIYGTKEQLWARLSAAERREAARLAVLDELAERRVAARAGMPS